MIDQTIEQIMGKTVPPWNEVIIRVQEMEHAQELAAIQKINEKWWYAVDD